MIEERRGGLMRRAYTALALWYVTAGCLLAGLAAWMTDAEIGTTPGHTYVEGRLEECTGQFGCPSEPADASAVLRSAALMLVASLLAAVPLCAYLARKWQMPALAGFISTVIGWILVGVGGVLFLSVRAR